MQCVMFHEVWTSNVKNVHDVWKVFLKTTFVVYACIVEFYVFVFDEIYVVGNKIVYKHILVRNFWVRIHIGPIRGPRRRIPSWSSILQGSGNRLPQTMASPPDDGLSMGGIDVFWRLRSFKRNQQTSSMGCGLTHGPSMMMSIGLWFLAVFS